jgi:hypothetical protein
MRTKFTTCVAISGIALLALGTVLPGQTQQSDAQARSKYQQQSWVQDHCDRDSHGQEVCRH